MRYVKPVYIADSERPCWIEGVNPDGMRFWTKRFPDAHILLSVQELPLENSGIQFRTSVMVGIGNSCPLCVSSWVVGEFELGEGLSWEEALEAAKVHTVDMWDWFIEGNLLDRFHIDREATEDSHKAYMSDLEEPTFYTNDES